MALAGVMSALRVQGKNPETELGNQRIVCVGMHSPLIFFFILLMMDVRIWVCGYGSYCRYYYGNEALWHDRRACKSIQTFDENNRIRRSARIKMTIKKKCFWLMDKDGLLGRMRTDLGDSQLPFLRLEDEFPDRMSLNDVIKKVKPTILLGLSGVGGVSFITLFILFIYTYAVLL